MRKKKLLLEKLEEIETAYLDLMKAYSSCLYALFKSENTGWFWYKAVLYLFSWDKVPGGDSEKLLRFLGDKFEIGWVEKAKIEKSDNGKTINIFKEGNSAEVSIDETEEKATLKIRGAEKTHDLKVERVDDELNILKVYRLIEMIRPVVQAIVLFMGQLLAPRFTKWHFKKKLNSLQAAFLLLIVQNRNKINSKIIKEFESYCEDMNKLSAQFEKSGLIAMFYAAIPLIPLITLIIAFGESIKPVFPEFSSEGSFTFIGLFIYLFLYAISFLIGGFLEMRFLFRETNVTEKENKIFVLIQKYLDFV